MYIRTSVWLALAIICTFVFAAFNFANPRDVFAASPSARQKLSPSYNCACNLATVAGETDRPAPDAPKVLAFVGVFTALKPERRHSLRATWFPSSVDGLARCDHF